MSFFEKLFGSAQSKKEENPNLKIYKLFKYNLKNICIDDNFIKVKEETIKEDKEKIFVETYQKILDYEECNLFSIVELIKEYPVVKGKRSTLAEPISQITFFSKNLSDIAVDDLESFINYLFEYYGGPDMTGEGAFAEDERNSFLSRCYVTGRIWSCSNYPDNFSISVLINNNRLELIINEGFSKF